MFTEFYIINYILGNYFILDGINYYFWSYNFFSFFRKNVLLMYIIIYLIVVIINIIISALYIYFRNFFILFMFTRVKNCMK